MLTGHILLTLINITRNVTVVNEVRTKVRTKVYDNDVYDETSRKTATTGSKFFPFFTIILNLGRVLNVNYHMLG